MSRLRVVQFPRWPGRWSLGLVALLMAGQARSVEVLDWGSVTGGGDLLTTPMSHDVGGITVTTSAQDSGGAWTRSVSRTDGELNGINGTIRMDMAAGIGTSYRWTQVTFTFSRPVTNLAFTAVDLDGGPSGAWNDVPPRLPVVSP